MFLISDSPLISCNLEIAFNLKKIVVMCWEWSGSLGGGGGDGGVAGGGGISPLPLVFGDSDIWLSGEKTLGAQKCCLCFYR
jgi:hypothetical protein